jgi:hypothetical protein
MNTFRLPEWLSPLTSPVSKDMTNVGGGLYETQWQLDLSHKQAKQETYSYLKRISGHTDAQMQAAGMHYGMFEDSSASLVFQQGRDRTSGSLFIDRAGTRTHFADNIMLMSGNLENNPVAEAVGARSRSRINRAFTGVLSALGLFDLPNFTGEHVLRYNQTDPITGKVASRVPGYIPVAASTGGIKSIDDFMLRTSYIRGIASFELDRFSRLAEGTVSSAVGLVDAFTGSDFASGFKNLGITGGIKPGSVTQRFARIGGLAMKVGGAALAVEQLDWLRRQGGIPAHVGVSGIVAGGVGYAASKLGKSPKTAMMAAVGSFFGQMVLPGFDKGLWPGAVSAYKNYDLLSAANPVSYYRRTLEGFAPGITNPTTGVALGVVALGAAYGRLPGVKHSLPSYLLERYGSDKLGLKHPRSVPLFAAESKHQAYMREVATHVRGNTAIDSSLLHTKAEQKKAMDALFAMYPERADFHKASAGLWSKAEDVVSNFAKTSPLNEALLSRLDEVANRYSGTGIGDRIMKQVAGVGEQVRHAFFGADPSELKDAIKAKGFLGGTGRAFTILAGAVLGHAALTGWPVASSESYDTLSKQYSGESLVEVRKSRYWEAGGTPFGGGDTSYFRPNYYQLTMNRVRERGIWGDNEDSISPIGKFYKKNFTYDLETANYWDRPYPISSQAFSDIPVIGSILGGSIGNLIKPARLMHVGEWAREGAGGGLEFAKVFEGSRREPSYEMGAQGQAIPISPYGADATMARLRNQTRELSGLTGWVKNMTFKALTGREIPRSTESPELASASQITSPLVQFKELSMGGGLFMNEAVRRMLPNDKPEFGRINPIMNSMPSWMPDKFHYGDPYRLVEQGEARMPGAGFAALHPELVGVDPEQYPMLARFAILGDVAPFTSEFRDVQKMLFTQRQNGQTSEAQNDYMDMISSTVKQRFNQQHYAGVADDALMLPGSGLVRDTGSVLGGFARSFIEPAEYLIPFGFRPTQKLFGDRDPIAQYEYERMYGTETAFWDKPWRDWFRPALMSSAHTLGYQGKPSWRKEADEVGQQFDQLEFVKWMRLAQQAEAQGDARSAQKYQSAAASTRMGVNPQGSPLSIYWTLPDSERQFFNAFATAQGSERNRILSMVPGDQAHLYEAVWDRMDSGDPTMNPAVSNSKIDLDYMKAQYAAASIDMPSDDWIGWREDVDMEDIKVRYVSNLGGDLHDYGLWESNLKKSMAQDFLDGSDDFTYTSGNTERAFEARTLYELSNDGTTPPRMAVHASNSVNNSVELYYNDNRDSDIMSKAGDYFGF